MADTPRRRTDDVEIEEVHKLLVRHSEAVYGRLDNVEATTKLCEETLITVERTQAGFSERLTEAREDQAKMIASQAVLEDRSERSLNVLERIEPVVVANATRLDGIERMESEQWTAINAARAGTSTVGKFLQKLSGGHITLIVFGVLGLVAFVAWIGGAIDFLGVRVDPTGISDLTEGGG